MKTIIPNVHTRHLLLVWIVIFTALTVIALDGNRELIGANKQRIDEIQASRTASCRQTYEAIRQVFRPFFPPDAHRSVKQRADIAKFNATIDRRKARCGAQTGSPAT